MAVGHDIEISPKLRIFATLKVYNHEEWTFIYRFMHNLLGLFAKCLINLEKQKHSSSVSR
jgi:hypothetical protein